MKRFHWGYFTPTNGVITYKESWKKHHYSIKHLRVELELKGTTKINTDFRHTHTYTSTYLVHSTPCLFLEKKAMCYVSWVFFTTKSGVNNPEVTFGNTLNVFGCGHQRPGRFPTKIRGFPGKKNKTKRVFPRFPMSHLMEWLTRAVGTSEENKSGPTGWAWKIRPGQKETVPKLREFYPICSMYGIFTYIWLIFMVNVGKYTIHGSYGYCWFFWRKSINLERPFLSWFFLGNKNSPKTQQSSRL